MTLTPQDLGLPAKYEDFRAGQLDSICDLIASEERTSLLSAPTGAGKSLIYVSLARMLGMRALVLVGTKGLQTQLMHDFAQIGMADMRGLANYRCVALDEHLADYGRPGASCAEGPCRVGVHCFLKKDGGCPYYDQQNVCRHAEMVVTNFSYWLTIGEYADPDILGQFDLLIIDEAHTMPAALSEYCTVELYRRRVRTELALTMPDADDGIQVWAEWARAALTEANERVARYRAYLEMQQRRATRTLIDLKELIRKLERLARAVEWKRSEPGRVDVVMPGARTDWVIESVEHRREGEGVKFAPVWPHAYAEPVLFRKIPRVVLVSATLAEVVAEQLGFDEYDYFETPSSFDPERRPFFYLPTTRVDHRWTDAQTRQWVLRIDNIIKGRLDRKGIIHTRSYARAKLLVAQSKHGHLMLTHTSRTARETIEEFKRAPEPCILVSPSVEEGHDFPHDQCRYQVIAKVPFMDGRSPLVAARKATDKDYVLYEAALTITQMYGRGMRSASDWCETFIVDDHWAWVRKNARLFPRWFQNSWREQLAVPEPLNF